MGRELERRFLLERLPDAGRLYEKQIRQVYWSLGDGWFLRLRRQGTSSRANDVVTIKGPRRGYARPEFEWPLDLAEGTEEGLKDALDAAVALYRAGSAHQVVKRRLGYEIDGLLWEIDVFMFENEGLIVAELEMDDMSKLRAVTVPSWAVSEITDDRRYDNENLAFTPYSAW